MIRRLLPLIILIPLIGWVRWRLQMAEVYGTSTGLVIFATINIVLLISVIWLVGSLLERSDQERERLAGEALDTRRSLEETLERITDAFYAVDRNYRVTYVNQRAQEYFGVGRSSLVGSILWEAVPAARGSIFQKEYSRAFAENVAIHFETVSPLTKRWVEVNAYPSAAGLSVFFRDIHDRKLSRQRLERLTEQLKRSNAELERFAYVASHDLQEPLRSMASTVQLIEQRYLDRLDERGCEFIHHAVDAAERMRLMIEDLLQLSRVETQQGQWTTVNMERVLQIVRTDLKKALDEASATLTHDRLPEVRGDELQLGELLQNLVNNAVKYCREGVPPQVHVGVQCQEINWQFRVEDNGIGIEEVYCDKVFEVFQRLNPRGKYAGTGIGLALCKKIVERHGGHIWVESQPGVGSTFYFTLPRGECC